MNDDDLKAAELAALAAVLAGPTASDEEIVAKFARASLLLLRAGDWLNDSAKRDAESQAYVLAIAECADARDPILPWNHPMLHAISGYDGDTYSKCTADERGRRLWDCFDKAIGRTFGGEAVKVLRSKFRAGIEASRFEQLWPQVSKWRRAKGGRAAGRQAPVAPVANSDN